VLLQSAYELPDLIAHNQTCATLGNDYWNRRPFLLPTDANYIEMTTSGNKFRSLANNSINLKQNFLAID
jgi:hypothetical protein